MSLEQEVELIRRFPIFSKIAPAKQKLLCFASERLTYNADEVLFNEGDPADACYVVIDGMITISVEVKKKLFVLSLMGRNELLGEIAVFGRGSRTATATAKTRVEVLRISAEQFRSVIRENPDAAMELVRILAERLVNTTQHLSQQSRPSED